MAHPLETARLKLGRAREHLKALDAEVSTFLDSEPYIYRAAYNHEVGQHPIQVRKLADPPLRLGIIAGDAAHCLRSCLDHIVYQLAALGPKGEAGRGERTQWPICETEKAWNKNVGEWLKGVPPIIRDKIQGAQPYKLRVEGHALIPLARLDDRDKHRVIDPIGASVGQPSVHVWQGTVLGVQVPKERVLLDDGAVIATLISPPGEHVGVEITMRPQIVFRANRDTTVTTGDLAAIARQVFELLGAFVDDFDPPPAHDSPPEG